MSEPEQKYENCANFKQNYTLKILMSLKMAYSCCFSLGKNLDFIDFPTKSFTTSTTDRQNALII